MLVQSLLLGAVAGVNALVGRNVEAVPISEKSFLCPDHCLYRDVFYSRSGQQCDEDHVRVAVGKDNQGRASRRFICLAEVLELRSGETVSHPEYKEISKCKLYPMEKFQDGCGGLTGGSDGTGETVQQPNAEIEACRERVENKTFTCLESNDGPRDFGSCEAQGQEELNQCLREQQ